MKTMENNKYLWKSYTIQVNYEEEDEEWENAEMFVLDENNQLQPVTQFEDIPDDIIDYIGFINKNETITTIYGEITRIW